MDRHIAVFVLYDDYKFHILYLSACDLDGSASAKEEGQGTPEKKVQVTFTIQTSNTSSFAFQYPNIPPLKCA